MNKQPVILRRQTGATLMELIAVLAVISTIVVGALAMFGSADSAQKSTQTVQEIAAMKAAVKALFIGQSGFGTASLNDTLVKARRVPSTVTADTTVTPPTLKNSSGSFYTVTGTGSTFTIAATLVPVDICIALISANGNVGSGYTTIATTANSGAASVASTAFPITPATAATMCAATGTLPTVTFTAS